MLFIDGSSNKGWAGSGIMLVSLEEYKIHCVLCFGFQASNSEAEYKALLTGLRLAKQLKICDLKVYNYSQLMVYQISYT